MEKVLLQNSENIKELLRLMKIHENNVANHSMQKEDVSMNLAPIPHPSPPIVSNTYMECEYALLPTWSIHPRVYFKPEDPMVLIKECGHTCRKEHFLQWIKKHHTCMDCSSVLF